MFDIVPFSAAKVVLRKSRHHMYGLSESGYLLVWSRVVNNPNLLFAKSTLNRFGARIPWSDFLCNNDKVLAGALRHRCTSREFEGPSLLLLGIEPSRQPTSLVQHAQTGRYGPVACDPACTGWPHSGRLSQLYPPESRCCDRTRRSGAPLRWSPTRGYSGSHGTS